MIKLDIYLTILILMDLPYWYHRFNGNCHFEIDILYSATIIIHLYDYMIFKIRSSQLASSINCLVCFSLFFF